jgi:hypothetical protein
MTGKEDGRTCATCRFVRENVYPETTQYEKTDIRYHAEQRIYSCHFAPPANSFTFPMVKADDWCGSWSAEVPKAEEKVDGWHE